MSIAPVVAAELVAVLVIFALAVVVDQSPVMLAAVLNFIGG